MMLSPRLLLLSKAVVRKVEREGLVAFWWTIFVE
jgi:hypothetical protein